MRLPLGAGSLAQSTPRSRRALFALVATSFAFTACNAASPTGVEAVHLNRPRTNLACVSTDKSVEVPTIVPADATGSCPVGFDVIPWT